MLWKKDIDYRITSKTYNYEGYEPKESRLRITSDVKQYNIFLTEDIDFFELCNYWDGTNENSLR